MPKFPDDIEAATAATERERKALAKLKKAAAKSPSRMSSSDEAAVRDLANNLRRKQGLPDLAPDEPVIGFFCTRGRRR